MKVIIRYCHNKNQFFRENNLAKKDLIGYHASFRSFMRILYMFSGSIVALVTPMQNDEIDIDALRALVEFHVKNGTQAIVAAGSTGESGSLSDEEKKQIFLHVIEQVNNRVPVIASTGYQSTKHTIELTEMAMRSGADAVLLMAPAYIRPTQEGLYQHYSHIAKTVPLPQILYNVPGRTACDLLPETIGRLSVYSNIIGVKEATGDLSRIDAIKKHSSGELDLFSGDDPTARDFMRLGGKGIISITANIAPKMMVDLCQACLAHDEKKADEIQQKLLPLHKAMMLEANPIPVKWALFKMGLIDNEIRLPLTSLSEKHQPTLEALLEGIH